MSVPTPQDLSPIMLRVERAEQDIKDVKSQLQAYVPIRENDLRLQTISQTVQRIEADVAKVKDQLVDMNNKLAIQAQDVQKRDAEQKESQSQLQIRVLVGVISSGFIVVSGILIGYITHFFK